LTPHQLRTALRILLVALGLVAFVAGLVTVFTGAGSIPGDNPTTPNVESELRFYATFWTGFGVFAWLSSGRPDAQFLVLMGLELTLPVFIFWAQARVASLRPADA
jgi:hypothetical protein